MTFSPHIAPAGLSPIPALTCPGTPEFELPSNHSDGYGFRSSPAPSRVCPASAWPRPVSRPIPGLTFSGILVQYAG